MMTSDTATTSITERLWARLEPLGWARYLWVADQQSLRMEFYPLGTDPQGGYISATVDGELHIEIAGDLTAWADGLRAVADIVDGKDQS
jgi:hypothetical protein